MKTLVQAFVSCRLDYCNSLLYGITDDSFRRLQGIQNAAARLVTGTRRREHITPVLRQLLELGDSGKTQLDSIRFDVLSIRFDSIHRCVVKTKDVLSCKLLINGLWININIKYQFYARSAEGIRRNVLLC